MAAAETLVIILRRNDALDLISMFKNLPCLLSLPYNPRRGHRSPNLERWKSKHYNVHRCQLKKSSAVIFFVDSKLYILFIVLSAVIAHPCFKKINWEK